MVYLKRILKIVITLSALLLFINYTYAQGTSCIDPIDLNPSVPVNGNGKLNIAVDNSSNSQFYTYTATQVGIIEMSSAYSNVPGDGTFDSWLKVYDSNCNLIFDEDDTPGFLGGVEFRTNVEIGDIYIFEWSNQEWAGEFTVEFIYHVPVNAITCDDSQDLVLGNNLADNWFGAKYYTHTATEDGLLEINTCNNPSAHNRYIEILDACNGNLLGTVDYSCDIDDDGYQLASYYMSQGETVIIKMEGYITHLHNDYDFTASFNVSLSNDEFYSKNFKIYPNPFQNEFSIDLKISEKLEDIKLYDITGRVIPIDWNKDDATSININTKTVESGAYVLMINNNYFKIILKD
jgi:hypothetical protein